MQNICGITTDSSAYCWGRNSWGEVGDGTRISRGLPTRVATERKFIAIATGNAATCALDFHGVMFCWGSNISAGLANGRVSETEIALTPQPALTGTRFRDVSADCALGLDGRVYCWGSFKNSGNVSEIHTEGGNCSTFYWWRFSGNDCVVPTPLRTTDTFAKLGGCPIKASGVMFCFGENPDGNLGNGTIGVGKHAITPVAVTSDKRFQQSSNTCALDVDGTAYCWGNNFFGQLGVGVAGDYRLVPFAVSTSERFVQIRSSGATTCALTHDERVWCWGSNTGGMLGPTFSGSRSYVPVLVQLPQL